MSEGAVERLYARRYQVLAAVMLGGIMGPIDGSIVNVILPTLTEYFKASISLVQWVPMIYLLTISSLLLLYGRLGDIYGYRKIYIAGLAGFVVTSTFCGLSPSIYWLIFSRAVQGLTAGLMMAVPFAIITAAFPPTERGKALGLNAISISAGLAIGPSLGGFITSLLGWRFAFLINIPIGLLGLYWAYRVIPPLRGEPGRVDLPGALASFIFLLSFLFFINRLQTSGRTLLTDAAVVVAVAALIAFLRLERRIPQPMLNLDLFQNTTFSFAGLSSLLNFMSQFVVVFLTPFYLQRALDYHPNRVGLIMTAFPLAVMAVAPFSGYLSDRIGTRLLPCLGATISAVATLLLSLLPAAAHPLQVIWRLALFGVGNGVFQSPNTSAAMGTVPRPYLGIASGVLATIRNVGMVLGIAAAGATLYAFATPQILEHPQMTQAGLNLFLAGLRRAYLVGAFLSAAAAFTSLVRSRFREAGAGVEAGPVRR